MRTEGKHSDIGKTSEVLYTKNIDAESLVNIYEALGRSAFGRVGVKISSGEMGGHYYLDPKLIEPLVSLVNGTIVECDTAYGGSRTETDKHWDTIIAHGFTEIAPCEIMDEEGQMTLPVRGGRRLKHDFVGKGLAKYDFIINLAHFKGHMMAGFGGVLKNMSIGIASSMGKSLIHSAGREKTGCSMTTPQIEFVESMAEAASAVAGYMDERIVYIDVMNNLSVDCDCDPNPHRPEIPDIGIFASLDPVALDQCCVDQVYDCKEGNNRPLIERMEKQLGVEILRHAEELGMGSRNYVVTDIDKC